jgi:hypothetical protein
MDAVGALWLRERGDSGDGHHCPGNLLLVFVTRPGFTLGGLGDSVYAPHVGFAVVHTVVVISPNQP